MCGGELSACARLIGPYTINEGELLTFAVTARDPDKRPARYDYAWQTVEYNDVGIDEFMILCRLINIDPYICVNIGFGDSYSAAQWVEYCNGSVDTPMSGLRAAVACETSARIMSFS